MDKQAKNLFLFTSRYGFRNNLQSLLTIPIIHIVLLLSSADTLNPQLYISILNDQPKDIASILGLAQVVGDLCGLSSFQEGILNKQSLVFVKHI